MEIEINKKKLKGALLTQTMLIGLLMVADQFFGFMEQNLFNTYLIHLLGLEAIYVSIMVSLTSVIGLIFFFIWGTKSDNTRTKWGRRRPYLIMGVYFSLIGITLLSLKFYDSIKNKFNRIEKILPIINFTSFMILAILIFVEILQV